MKRCTLPLMVMMMMMQMTRKTWTDQGGGRCPIATEQLSAEHSSLPLCVGNLTNPQSFVCLPVVMFVCCVYVLSLLDNRRSNYTTCVVQVTPPLPCSNCNVPIEKCSESTVYAHEQTHSPNRTDE